MPHNRGRLNSNVKKVAGRRNHSLGRTSLGESNCKLVSEERQISALVLGNAEQRCIILTLIAPEVDAYCKLITILQSLESPDKRNHSPSTALSESQRTIIFVINLPKEHRSNISEDTCLPENSSDNSSSGMKVMSQSRNRNKRTKPFKDCSNTSAPRCLAVNASSGSLCESWSPLSSDDLVSDISRVEQPLKRSSKKKGKKKGKNHKRSPSKKDSIELEGPCEKSTCSGPVAEVSVVCSPTYLNEQISENLCEKLGCPRPLVGNDVTVQKNDYGTNNCAGSSTTMPSCIRYDVEMGESEVGVSLSEQSAHEEFTSHSTSELTNRSGATEPLESVFSTAVVDRRSASPKQGISCNGNSSCISLDSYDGAMIGSFRDNGEIDFSGNCTNDVERRSPIECKGGFNTSEELDSDSRKSNPSFHGVDIDSLVVNREVTDDCGTSDSHWPSSVGNADSSERAKCSSQACSSNDFHPVLSGKRGRTAKKLAVHTRKDNNHSIWQKVQKIDDPGCANKTRNAYAVSPKVDTHKESVTRIRSDAASVSTQKVKSGKQLYPGEVVQETSKSIEVNTKKKHISISKQVSHHPRKGSHDSTVNYARPSKIHVHQKEGPKISPQVSRDEDTSSGLCSSADFPKRMDKSTEHCDPYSSVQHEKAKEHINEAALSRSTAGAITLSVPCKQISLPLLTKTSSGQSPAKGTEGHASKNDLSSCENAHNDFCLADRTDDQHKKLQAECSHTENNEADNNFGAVLQRWVPVARKDATILRTENADHLVASLVDECPTLVDSKDDDVEARSDVACSVSPTGVEMQCSSRSGDDADCSSSETDTFSDRLTCRSSTAGGSGVPEELNLQLACELKDRHFSNFETHLAKIIRAVNDTHKVHSIQCDHLIFGSPLAEFERFLRSAAPVTSLRCCSETCMTCSRKEEAGRALCSHQIHYISLASLWQWYEEPGCYGLEVKAEDDRKSKTLCDGFVEFRAYFVPYLSAVQLFRRSGSSYVGLNGEMRVSCQVDKASRSSSNLSSVPMFSELLPKPHIEVKECLQESTLSSANEFYDQPAKDANLIDEELIFEYFEHAQPPQRRPLFAKIKELVNGDQSSNSQMYGDPLKLECLSLHDVHPASWYAVAWYPIYRIPEGNLRAAFLTYHSLGHFVRQSTFDNNSGDFTRIISPVVGLQSYNAKKECWFQPRDLNSMETEKEAASVSSPSNLLQERLKTLEHTASLMATAAVLKGNQRSINSHPDYNHFFSRW